MSKKECSINKKTSIGGQALIEGIMMRGPKTSAMAVRNPAGEIVLEKWETQSSNPPKFLKLPIIRGVYNFIISMKAGYKCLMRSAEISGLEELEEEAKHEKAHKKAEKARKKAEKAGVPFEEKADTETNEASMASENSQASAEDSGMEKKSDKKGESSLLMNVIMVIAAALGIFLSVALFIMLPSFIYKWVSELLPFLRPENPALLSLVKSVFEGVLKILILVGYMLLVSLMKDIRRTFQYHGAEHKTIFCYEHGKELTVANVKAERRFHPRCGTSFLILMLLVGIFISFFIDPVSILITGNVPPTYIRAIIRLLLLPIVMGIGHELIKLAGRRDNLFTRIISAPGVWLQHLTVFEPDDDMIECAITAFKEVIPEDNSDNY
ncbi:MAG: DUF1385 domain-containing protein [Clostridia bacterium]|nr:DUF1385 domain-containing protein [Clostridia bacterium]